MFNKEGSAGIDVKVPSTNDREKLIWEHARTEEVQKCRQIAAISTVILMEKNYAMRRPKAQGNLWHRTSQWTANGNLEHEQPPIQGSIWSIVPCSRDLPVKTQSGLSQNTARLTRHVGKRDRTGRSYSKRQPGHDERTDPVSDSRKAHQSNSERKLWSITDDRSAIVSKDSYQFSTRRTCVHQSSSRSLRRESGSFDVVSQKIEKGYVRIIAVSYWILKTWRFMKIWRTCDRRIWNTQRQESILTRVAIGSEPRHDVQALPPLEKPSWPIVCGWSGSSAECAGILSGQRTGVSCATTQFRPSSSQRSSTSKTDQKGPKKKKIKRRNRLPSKIVDTTTDSR